MENTLKILVTGATGNIGGLIAEQLFDKGYPVRVSSRNSETAVFRSDYEVVTLNMEKPETYHTALDGVNKVFLYAYGARLPEFLAFAKGSGVEHIVLLSSSSVLSYDLEDFNAELHKIAEDDVRASGLLWTFLRPGSFAYNILGPWKHQIKYNKTVKMAYPNATTAPIHEKDIADVAVTVLTSNRYIGHALTLTGLQSLSQVEQVRIIAEVLKEDIKIETLSHDAARLCMAQFIPEHYADMRLRLLKKTADIPSLVTNTVQEVTGHLARAFEDWVRDNIDAFL